MQNMFDDSLNTLNCHSVTSVNGHLEAQNCTPAELERLALCQPAVTACLRFTPAYTYFVLVWGQIRFCTGHRCTVHSLTCKKNMHGCSLWWCCMYLMLAAATPTIYLLNTRPVITLNIGGFSWPTVFSVSNRSRVTFTELGDRVYITESSQKMHL